MSHHEKPTSDFAFHRIGIIGAGSMGSMMSLGFAEKGLKVSLWDINPDNVRGAIEKAKNTDSVKDKVEGHTEVKEFAKSFAEQGRKLIVYSITHGDPVDQVLSLLLKEDILVKDDIVLDGGNEHYRNTERRQKSLQERGVLWIGMGVSGGYQSARRGPSMSPGGDRSAVEMVLPLLEKFAAKGKGADGQERPCVEYIGPRGAGHYVKMVHNGIENGMLAAVSEAWSLMHKNLGMGYEEIGQVFEKWNEDGELRGTYLVQIASEICQRKTTTVAKGDDEDNDGGRFVLDEVLDKVVQDDDNSEGTLYWTVMEAANRHIAAPTIATGHFIRVASGDRAQRLKVAEKLRMPSPKKIDISSGDKDSVIEDLRRAVYATTLASFCQGLELIARASRDEEWNIDLAACIRIWRSGCIIQCDSIADMLEPILASNTKSQEPRSIMNLKLIDEVADALHQQYEPLKRTTLKAIEYDGYVPSISATLEYVKYVGGTKLPTQFMEAQLDFFGAHAYDRPGVKGEDPGKASKGANHYEWRSA
jgi:6-phosphogluconate dehydrogenase